MKTTGPDEFVDVPPEEIERLSLVQKDRITAGNNSGKVSLIPDPNDQNPCAHLRNPMGGVKVDPEWDGHGKPPCASLNQTHAASNSPDESHLQGLGISHKKETIRLKLLFGGGSH